MRVDFTLNENGTEEVTVIGLAVVHGIHLGRTDVIAAVVELFELPHVVFLVGLVHITTAIALKSLGIAGNEHIEPAVLHGTEVLDGVGLSIPCSILAGHILVDANHQALIGQTGLRTIGITLIKKHFCPGIVEVQRIAHHYVTRTVNRWLHPLGRSRQSAQSDCHCQ